MRDCGHVQGLGECSSCDEEVRGCCKEERNAIDEKQKRHGEQKCLERKNTGNKAAGK